MNDPRDHMNKDDVLLAWQSAKNTLELAKQAEMEWRKYIVKRAFPSASEGVNTQDIGNGYKLKASVKFNYTLDKDLTKVGQACKKIANIGNEGVFIQERLITWTPEFHITEYRNLQQSAKDGSLQAQEMLKIISEVLTITDATPTLSIKEPKKSKK